MKKRLISGMLLLALALTAAPAAVAAQAEDHNCAGAVSSGLAQQLGAVFGAAVSGAAQAQAVDNFGAANCGGAQGQNP